MARHLTIIKELTNQAVLDADPKVAAGQKRILDQILAIMEHERYRTRNKPESEYPRDYTIRWMEAIVAEAAGYEDRANWSFIENAVRTDLNL